jgi:hypothetical protein
MLEQFLAHKRSQSNYISASLTIPTGECCDRKHAPYCCSGIPVCSDGGNATVEAVNFKTDPCLTPWNSSACMEGFYTTSGVDILPCPAGMCLESLIIRGGHVS